MKTTRSPEVPWTLLVYGPACRHPQKTPGAGLRWIDMDRLIRLASEPMTITPQLRLGIRRKPVWCCGGWDESFAHTPVTLLGSSMTKTSENLNCCLSNFYVRIPGIEIFFKKFEKKCTRSRVRTPDLRICNSPPLPICYKHFVMEGGTDAYESECVFAFSFLFSLF